MNVGYSFYAYAEELGHKIALLLFIVGIYANVVSQAIKTELKIVMRKKLTVATRLGFYLDSTRRSIFVGHPLR